MLAPARIPVAAGKKMANTEKNVSSSLKSGPRFSKKMAAVRRKRHNGEYLDFYLSFHTVNVTGGGFHWGGTVRVRVRVRLTAMAEESFGFFALCWHEASYEVVSDGAQQDHQEDNLSLMDRETEGKPRVMLHARLFII